MIYKDGLLRGVQSISFNENKLNMKNNYVQQSVSQPLYFIYTFTS